MWAVVPVGPVSMDPKSIKFDDSDPAVPCKVAVDNVEHGPHGPPSTPPGDPRPTGHRSDQPRPAYAIRLLPKLPYRAMSIARTPPSLPHSPCPSLERAEST